MSQIGNDPAPPAMDGAEPSPGNAVALIGLVLTMAAMLFCGLLFGAASQLAANDQQRQAEAETRAALPGNSDNGDSDAEVTDAQSARNAEQLRVLLLASVAAVLNLVGLVLCIVGLFVPNRPRAIAIGGTILSALLLTGVFGVMAIGALLPG